MTIEEAINQLKNVTIYHEGKCTREALDLAIDALKCVNSSAFKDGYKKGREDAIREIEMDCNSCEGTENCSYTLGYNEGFKDGCEQIGRAKNDI